jgi:hypothetical protein
MSPHNFLPLVTGPAAWLLLMAVGSVGYRLSRGKPILFFTVKDAQFIRHLGSGRARKPWWRGFGHANNCLVVAVAQGRFIVRPYFPFTLMFLPELLGLDVDVPLERITGVSEKAGWFTTWLVVAFTTADGEPREVWLRLRNHGELLRLLAAKAA